MDARKETSSNRRSSHAVCECMALVALLIFPVGLLLITRDRKVSATFSLEKAPVMSPIVSMDRDLSTVQESPGDSIHRYSSTIKSPLGSVLRNSSIFIEPPEWMTEPLFHSPKILAVDYADMKANLKIYIYPYPGNNVSMAFGGSAVPREVPLPYGNYASEPYLFRNLHESELRTNDPNKAHFFALPFSTWNLRMTLGPLAVPGWVRMFMEETVTPKWPYWNRTGGSDHFYFTCHDIGVLAAGKTPYLSGSAIQIICPANRMRHEYIPTKDFSFPQIWPHYDAKPGGLSASKRKKTKILAFWSGSQNSRVRKVLWETWANDSEILLGEGRVLKKKPRGNDYYSNFRKAKYCLHATGYQVHTARIGDAINFGCVPVIISDQFDLPFSDLLNWSEFAVIVPESQVPELKTILKSISDKTYRKLHANVQTILRLFTWNSPPQDYDTFHMVMYDLWLRRYVVRPSLDQDMISR